MITKIKRFIVSISFLCQNTNLPLQCKKIPCNIFLVRSIISTWFVNRPIVPLLNQVFTVPCTCRLQVHGQETGINLCCCDLTSVSYKGGCSCITFSNSSDTFTLDIYIRTLLRQST